MSNGTLDTGEDAVIRGHLDWDNGVHTGDATTIIADGATALFGTGALYLRGGRDFINHGTVTQERLRGYASRTRRMRPRTSPMRSVRSGRWTCNNHERMVYPNNPTATMNFINAGTLTKISAGLNHLGYTNGTFNLTNTGTIEVESGTLGLSENANSVFSGPVDLAVGDDFVAAGWTDHV